MSAYATGSLVNEVLTEYGQLTRSEVSRYLPNREPRRYLYDLVADYPNRGGKMMRPSICIAAAKAFGATEQEALLSAVSIELLHNALLIHDDIEDESEERRGKPTMHEMHGIPIAINVGDMLTLLSLKPLFRNYEILGPELTYRLIQETEQVAQESAEGQALELGWRKDNLLDVTEADYLEMVLKKTCFLATIYPLRLGALIGTRGRIDTEHFTRYGFFLGAAFQIQDDILNLFADDKYGKELNGDIWEGKRTLILIHLLSACTPDEYGRVCATLRLQREEKCTEEVAWIRATIERYGSIEYARQVAHGLAGAALVEFDNAFAQVPESRDKAFLRQLAYWVFKRD